MDSSTVEKWRKELLFKINGGYKHMIYNASEAGLFSRLPPDKTWSLKGDPCNGGKNSNEINFFLACKAYKTNKLLPLVRGKEEKPQRFKRFSQRLRSQQKSMGYIGHLYEYYGKLMQNR